MGTNRRDAQARRARLAELMGRLADGDGTAAVSLAMEFSTSIGAAVRAHLLEMAGDSAAAAIQYRVAARRTTSLPEQRYLDGRAAALDRPG